MSIPHRAAALLSLFVLAWAAPALAGNWEAIENLVGERARTVMVDGHPRLYYRVAPDHPLQIPIDGPARLRLTSRVEFAKGRASVVSYTLRVLEGGREIEHQDTEAAPSARVAGAGTEGGVGKSRRMTVDVPAGHHEIRVLTEGAGGVLVRLHQSAGGRGEQPTVSLTPIDAWRSVMIVEGEKSIPYYSIKAGKPVRLRLVGPVNLELISRLDFDSAMRGTHRYQFAVTEKGKRLRVMEFKTTKTTTASFSNLPDRVPSKFDRVMLPFTEGTHEILIQLLAPAGAVAEIHARIPQPSIGKEE